MIGIFGMIFNKTRRMEVLVCGVYMPMNACICMCANMNKNILNYKKKDLYSMYYSSV